LNYFILLVASGIIHPWLRAQSRLRQALSTFSGYTFSEARSWHNYQPDNQVHFTTPARGQEEPVVWTRRTAAGRICYFAPGHLGSTWQIPQVRTILKRGLAWVCEENSSQEYET
jgi:type 1 glutamine amidotransferase